MIDRSAAGPPAAAHVTARPTATTPHGCEFSADVCELGAVGKSPKPERAETGAYWTQARDVESLREHLGQERLTTIGHSAGTRLAISYAAQYPERVARLLLVTPPSTYLVDEPADAAELIGERSGDPVFDKLLPRSKAAPICPTRQRSMPGSRRAPRLGTPPGRQLNRSTHNWGSSTLPRRRRFSVQPPQRSGRQVRCGEGTDIGARWRAGLSDGCAAGEGAGEAFPER
ncbi:alpha/beta fold hydrolase [Actinophytocola glycyrrhizae]|uniref:Alpha/beta fold hydrolase n=1 Tax=Actinophytocola glycyrrhizae TaxID=2044873 RepID=A0ABV9S8G0_9PSEU